MYIDSEKLIAEIERYKQRAAIARFDNARENADYFQGKVDLCNDLTHIITSLQQEQPSLPSGLDKAAEKKARDIFESLEKYDIGEEKNRVLFGLLELEALALTFSHFGAEWMEGQGQTFEAHVDNGCAIASGVKLPFILWDTYEDGDVLKVQVRKKQ